MPRPKIQVSRKPAGYQAFSIGTGGRRAGQHTVTAARTRRTAAQGPRRAGAQPVRTGPSPAAVRRVLPDQPVLVARPLRTLNRPTMTPDCHTFESMFWASALVQCSTRSPRG